MCHHVVANDFKLKSIEVEGGKVVTSVTYYLDR